MCDSSHNDEFDPTIAEELARADGVDVEIVRERMQAMANENDYSDTRWGEVDSGDREEYEEEGVSVDLNTVVEENTNPDGL